MEMLIELIAFLAEIAVEALIYLPMDRYFFGDDRPAGRDGCVAFFATIAMGALLGWLSTLIAPHLLLPSAGWQIANLVVAPVVTGGIAWWIANLNPTGIAKTSRMSHFWFGFWFTLAFAGARLIEGVR